MRLTMTNKELLALVEKATGLKIDTIIIDKNDDILYSVYIKKDEVAISDYWKEELIKKHLKSK